MTESKIGFDPNEKILHDLADDSSKYYDEPKALKKVPADLLVEHQDLAVRIVTEGGRGGGGYFEYLPEVLKNDKSFVLRCLEPELENQNIQQYLSPELMEDVDIAIAILQASGFEFNSYYPEFPDTVKQNPEVQSLYQKMCQKYKGG